MKHHCPWAGTKLHRLVTEAHVCEQLAQDCYMKVELPHSPATCWLQRPNHYTIMPHKVLKAWFYYNIILIISIILIFLLSIVSNSIIDCVERLVSEMTHYVFSLWLEWDIKLYSLTHSCYFSANSANITHRYRIHCCNISSHVHMPFYGPFSRYTWVSLCSHKRVTYWNNHWIYMSQMSFQPLNL